MEQNYIDKGLRKAIKNLSSPRISTNFTFNTMQKVEESLRLKEHKREKLIFWSIIVGSVFLLVGGVIVISQLREEECLSMFIDVYTVFTNLDILSSPYPFLSLMILSMLGLDYWMRHIYYKRHKKR